MPLFFPAWPQACKVHGLPEMTEDEFYGELPAACSTLQPACSNLLPSLPVISSHCRFRGRADARHRAEHLRSRTRRGESARIIRCGIPGEPAGLRDRGPPPAGTSLHQQLVDQVARVLECWSMRRRPGGGQPRTYPGSARLNPSWRAGRGAAGAPGEDRVRAAGGGGGAYGRAASGAGHLWAEGRGAGAHIPCGAGAHIQ